MVQIDRSTPPHVIRAFRARLGQSQEALSADLGLGENAVYRYEQLGAPAWVRYALLGLAVCKHRVPVAEAERLVGLKPGGRARRAPAERAGERITRARTPTTTTSTAEERGRGTR